MRTWCARSALRNALASCGLARRSPPSASRQPTSSPSPSRTGKPCSLQPRGHEAPPVNPRSTQRPTPRGRGGPTESGHLPCGRQPRAGCSTSLALAPAEARAGRERRPRGAPVQTTDGRGSGRDLRRAGGTRRRAGPATGRGRAAPGAGRCPAATPRRSCGPGSR